MNDAKLGLSYLNVINTREQYYMKRTKQEFIWGLRFPSAHFGVGGLWWLQAWFYITFLKAKHLLIEVFKSIENSFGNFIYF